MVMIIGNCSAQLVNCGGVAIPGKGGGSAVVRGYAVTKLTTLTEQKLFRRFVLSHPDAAPLARGVIAWGESFSDFIQKVAWLRRRGLAPVEAAGEPAGDGEQPALTAQGEMAQASADASTFAEGPGLTEPGGPGMTGEPAYPER